MVQARAKRTNIFISYSHKDARWLERLRLHLKPLINDNEISVWDDTKIQPGSAWRAEIEQAIQSTKVAILLVSADFLASDYCFDIELKRAMERHAEGKARVIPIIIRKCDWSSAPFGKLQALPKNARPIRNWDDPDEAYTDVVAGIRRAITEMVP